MLADVSTRLETKIFFEKKTSFTHLSVREVGISKYRNLPFASEGATPSLHPTIQPTLKQNGLIFKLNELLFEQNNLMCKLEVVVSKWMDANLHMYIDISGAPSWHSTIQVVVKSDKLILQVHELILK